MDPTAALQALIGRETTAPRTVAAAAPTGPKRGVFRSSGGGATPTMTAGDAAMAMARNPMEGEHGFVRYENTHGAGLTGAGGFYGTTQGSPGAAWGGWRLPGQVTAPQNEAFAVNRGGNPGGGGIDPAFKSEEQKRAEMLAGLGPSLAENQWRERNAGGRK
jgi:hypothetical protein